MIFVWETGRLHAHAIIVFFVHFLFGLTEAKVNNLFEMYIKEQIRILLYKLVDFWLNINMNIYSMFLNVCPAEFQTKTRHLYIYLCRPTFIKWILKNLRIKNLRKIISINLAHKTKYKSHILCVQ